VAFSPVAVPALFALTTVAFYWEIVLPGWILADYDIWTYFYPLRSYAAQALQAGRFPLWNPDTFLGAPFFANPQTSLLYPGTLVFFVLPLGYAYSDSVIVHVFLAAVLAYAFFRGSFGVGRAAAVVGGLAFAFGGFITAQAGHINQLSASAWLPGIALATDRAVAQRSLRWTAAAATGLAVQLLAGHAQETYMTLWAIALLLLWRMVVARPSDDQGPKSNVQRPTDVQGPMSNVQTVRGPSLGFGPGTLDRLRNALLHVMLPPAVGVVVVGLGFGIAAVQLVPTAELVAHSIRGGGMPYLEATAFSLPPPLLFRALLPGYWYNPFSEYVGYVGGVALGFALVGLLWGRWSPMLYAATIGCVGLFLAIGSANPLYRPLLELVPGLDLFRVPARWLFLYTFGAAGLAALGVDAVLSRGRVSSFGFRVSSSRPNAELETRNSKLPTAFWRWAILIPIGLALASALQAFPPAVPGRVVALWLAAVGGSLLLALLALRRPGAPVAIAIIALTLGELRLAALDFPSQHPVPEEALSGQRTVPAYLKKRPEGRLLSAARTEYELADNDKIVARYPDLDPSASFAFKSALKLDEVMSPNVPLRYGLSTADGYDGGVLPLRRYIDLMSLLVPPEEIRADGVLRTRLIAVPEELLLRLLRVRAIVAGRVSDVELDGVRFDIGTARTLRAGQSLRVDLPRPVGVEAIELLSSTQGVGGPSGEGRMTLLRADGTRDEVPLRPGETIFPEARPGPRNLLQPTAGLSRAGRSDSAVRVPVSAGSAPVTAIEWSWAGSTPWTLRAATLLTHDGSAEELVLQPALRRTLFPDLKIYERSLEPAVYRLAPRWEVADDRRALAFLRTADSVGLDDAVVLASDPPLPLGLSPQSSAISPQSTPSVFLRRPQPVPERLVFERAQGEGAGILLVDDAWFPGWRAEVDGRESPVLRGDLHFKAVYVPPGGRTVVLTYEPESVRSGAIVSALSVGISFLLLALSFHRQRRHRAV
jgi:hypothetical protein